LVTIGTSAVFLSQGQGPAPRVPAKREPIVRGLIDLNGSNALPGFTQYQSERIGVLHGNTVTTLDDLAPTKGGIVIQADRAGKKRVIIKPKFGMSRMDIQVPHAGDRLVSPLKRSEGAAGEAERLEQLVISADGRPLKEDNLKVKWRNYFANVSRDKVSVEAARTIWPKRFPGMEYGFESDNGAAWAVPIKLTRKECLPCHSGMKVGDTVGIAVYFARKSKYVARDGSKTEK